MRLIQVPNNRAKYYFLELVYIFVCLFFKFNYVFINQGGRVTEVLKFMPKDIKINKIKLKKIREKKAQ